MLIPTKIGPRSQIWQKDAGYRIALRSAIIVSDFPHRLWFCGRSLNCRPIRQEIEASSRGSRAKGSFHSRWPGKIPGTGREREAESNGQVSTAKSLVRLQTGGKLECFAKHFTSRKRLLLRSRGSRFSIPSTLLSTALDFPTTGLFVPFVPLSGLLRTSRVSAACRILFDSDSLQ